MITKLRNILDCMVDDELKWARKEHGEKFASDHEAYAVTLEEVQEALEEIAVAHNLLDDIWEMCIRKDDYVSTVMLEQLDQHAINGAAELIQVAAMARKWKESGLK